MKSSIGLIDYGMGNLHSVKKAFIRLQEDVKIVQAPSDLKGCKALVLPGVGAFDPAMESLRSTGLIPFLLDWVKMGKPLLGICLGLQLLFESSDEGSLDGLGLLKGHIKRLPEDLEERIPHMGWSLTKRHRNCPIWDSGEKDSWLYFVHSYSAITERDLDLIATCDFGAEKITAIVWKDNLGACQFHPEKSGKEGNKMLANWVKWIDKQSSCSR